MHALNCWKNFIGEKFRKTETKLFLLCVDASPVSDR